MLQIGLLKFDLTMRSLKILPHRAMIRDYIWSVLMCLGPMPLQQL